MADRAETSRTSIVIRQPPARPTDSAPLRIAPDRSPIGLGANALAKRPRRFARRPAEPVREVRLLLEAEPERQLLHRMLFLDQHLAGVIESAPFVVGAGRDAHVRHEQPRELTGA